MKLEELRRRLGSGAEYGDEFVLVTLSASEVLDGQSAIPIMKSIFRENGLEPSLWFRFLGWSKIRRPAFVLNGTVRNPQKSFEGEQKTQDGKLVYDFKIPKRFAEKDVILEADSPALPPLDLLRINRRLEDIGVVAKAETHYGNQHKKGPTLHFSNGLIVEGQADFLVPELVWYPIRVADLTRVAP